MSGRCKSCDSILTDEEIRKRDNQGMYHDLCSSCIYDILVSDYETYDSRFNSDFFFEGRRGGSHADGF